MFVPAGPVHGSPERHGSVQVNCPFGHYRQPGIVVRDADVAVRQRLEDLVEGGDVLTEGRGRSRGGSPTRTTLVPTDRKIEIAVWVSASYFE